MKNSKTLTGLMALVGVQFSSSNTSAQVNDLGADVNIDKLSATEIYYGDISKNYLPNDANACCSNGGCTCNGGC
jgi:hypothetical protein